MIRNLGWLALHHGLGRGLTFVFFLALPALLPMAEVGRFTLLYTAVLVLAQPLLETPLELLLTTAAARGELGTVRRVVAALVRWLPVLLVTGWLVGVAAGAPALLLALLVLHLGLARSQAALFATLRGLEQTRLEGVVGALQRALALGLLLVVVLLLPGRAEAAALALLAGVAGGWLLSFAFFGRQLAQLRATVRQAAPSAERLSSLLRRGLVLGAVSVVGALYLRVDVLLLGWLVDAEAVGRYFTAARVLEASYGLPHLIMLAMLPRLARAPAFALVFRRAAVVFLGLGTVVAVALTVVVPWLLPRLYPDEGPAVAGLVVVLAPAAVAVYLGFLATQSLALLGRARTWLGLATLGLALNLALDVALIPAWGAIGAAWATVATELVVALPALLVCWRAAAARSDNGPQASSSASSC